MILLDTVVVSELRKSRPSSKVVAWLRSLADDEMFLSVITIGEIERGIARTADAGFREALERWLDDLVRLYGDRLLPVTAAIAKRWGRFSADLDIDGADLLIAATAAEHGLTVATRNVRHFTPTKVAVVDPFR